MCQNNCGQCEDCCKRLAIGNAAKLGLDGQDGATWYVGAGAPGGGLGLINDLYLNITNGDVYKKTDLAVWTLQGNIKVTPGAWQAATAIYGTDQFGNAFIDDFVSPIRYRKEGDLLRISGKINNAVVSTLCNTLTNLMTLPAGYRPATTQYMTVMDEAGGWPLSVIVTTSGTVLIQYQILGTGGAYNIVTGRNNTIAFNNAVPLA